MSKKDRERIARWLESEAASLREHGDEYGTHFTCRLWPKDGTDQEDIFDLGNIRDLKVGDQVRRLHLVIEWLVHDLREALDEC